MERTHDDVQRLADLAEWFCGRWYRGQSLDYDTRLAVIIGPPGVGKTHASKKIWHWARAVAATRWEQLPQCGNRVESIEMASWAIIASAERTPDDEFDRWVEDCESASLVIIDDIGTETDQYKSGIPTWRLCHILNRFKRQWLWITTNKKSDSWTATWDVRVADRLMAGDVVEVNAPSWRSDR